MNALARIKEAIGNKAFALKQRVKDAVRGERTKRSPHWPAVRRDWLRFHPACAACGGLASPEVHHVVPFSIDPARELDSKNLITLCETATRCHLTTGHFGNWRSYNPHVREDAAQKLKGPRES